MSEFLHNHPGLESRLGLDNDHVIVDKCDAIVARELRNAGSYWVGIDYAADTLEKAREEGRQEVVALINKSLEYYDKNVSAATPSTVLRKLLCLIAPKSRRYVVAPAGAAGAPEITKEFQNELAQLINKHSVENQVDMPDFIMAEMLCNIIEAVGPKVKKTLNWHGCDSICHSKEKRYVVALAGTELGADEVRIESYGPFGIAIECNQVIRAPFTEPVYLKPGWTSDKECRDIVAKLLRDGVEIREEN